VAVFFRREAVELGGLCGVTSLEPVGEIMINAGVLFFEGNRQSEDLLFGEAGRSCAWILSVACIGNIAVSWKQVSNLAPFRKTDVQKNRRETTLGGFVDSDATAIGAIEHSTLELAAAPRATAMRAIQTGQQISEPGSGAASEWKCLATQRGCRCSKLELNEHGHRVGRWKNRVPRNRNGPSAHMPRGDPGRRSGSSVLNSGKSGKDGSRNVW